jgi:hypothetical protein
MKPFEQKRTEVRNRGDYDGRFGLKSREGASYSEPGEAF